jgi:hypothetical protein
MPWVRSSWPRLISLQPEDVDRGIHRQPESPRTWARSRRAVPGVNLPPDALKELDGLSASACFR